MSSSDPVPSANYVPPLAGKLMSGSVWMIGMRWSMRLIGLASTAVLARLLMPDDFGVVALAMIFVGFVGSLTDFGVSMALIQNPRAERRHYDAAWTLQILQNTGVAAIILAVAPFTGDYFGDERVPIIVSFVALSVFLDGFINVGVIDFRKKLQFERDFTYTALNKFGRAAVTILLALYLRNYWALVWGGVAGTLLEIGLSYIMSPYRPRLAKRALREILSFSQWMLFINSITFILNRSDRLIIGRIVPASTFGLYTMGCELSSMPTTEFVMPIIRAVDSGISSFREHIERFRAAVLMVFSGIAFFVVPAGIGFMLLSREFVEIVLSAKWLATVPIIEAAALNAVVATGIIAFRHVLIRAEKIKATAAILSFEAAVLLAAIYPAYVAGGLVGVIYAKLVIGALALIVMAIVLGRKIGISPSEYFGIIWRPIIATGAMAAAIHWLNAQLSLGILVMLALKVIVGAAVYGIGVIILWFGSGRPDGVERLVLRTVGAKLRLYFGANA